MVFAWPHRITLTHYSHVELVEINSPSNAILSDTVVYPATADPDFELSELSDLTELTESESDEDNTINAGRYRNGAYTTISYHFQPNDLICIQSEHSASESTSPY